MERSGFGSEAIQTTTSFCPKMPWNGTDRAGTDDLLRMKPPALAPQNFPGHPKQSLKNWDVSRVVPTYPQESRENRQPGVNRIFYGFAKSCKRYVDPITRF